MAAASFSSYSEKVSELWLIRKADNEILGPVSREELSRRVLTGEFDEDDEFCSGSGYWFFLHERLEMKKWLGIEAPRRPHLSDEDTTDTGRLSLVDPVEQTDRLSHQVPDLTVLEDAQVTQVFSIQSLEEHTRKRGWNHPIKPRPQAVAPSVATAARTVPRAPSGSPFARKNPLQSVESPSFFKGAAWLLVVAILLVIYTLLRVLRTAA